MLAIIVLACVLAPLIAHYGPNDIDLRGRNQPPGGMHWLGTDGTGRDIFARILYGGRISLTVGFVAVAISAAIGIFIGCVAGYFGGKVDLVLMRVTELFQTVPAFILAILLVATFSPSLLTIILTIGAVSWPPLARLTRAEFLRLRGREFVEAALCQGESTARIVLGHILPNAISPILVVVSLTVATAILLESALSFMGLGDPNLMSWGFMIGAGRTVIRQAWWMSVFPGLAILITVLAINLFGEGLSDVLNPRVSRRRA
jgi:peptide/nickel transport system permease protein